MLSYNSKDGFLSQMHVLKCPNCHKQEIVKNGKVHGNQRYLCKKCGYTFTCLHKKEYSVGRRQTLIKHYLSGESLRSIERKFKQKGKRGPSNVTMLYWINELDKKIANPDVTEKEYCLDFRDRKFFRNMCNYLAGRSIRKLKREDRRYLSGYLYIIFKLIKKVLPKEEVDKIKAQRLQHSTKQKYDENKQLEAIFQKFVTKKKK